MFLLTIESDRVVVKFGGRLGGKMTRVVRSVEDFRQFLVSKANEAGCTVDSLTVILSSTMDFPEDATDNHDVISLAKRIRDS